MTRRSSPGAGTTRRERDDRPAFVPRTGLGQALWELRRQFVATGAPLLTWDEIEAEIAESRGEA